MGWAVFGVAANLVPVAIGLIQHRCLSLASVSWMKLVSDNQAEIQIGLGLLVIAAYLIYAPYRIQKEQIIYGKKERERLSESTRIQQSQSDSEISNLKATLDDKAKRRELADRLGGAMEQGRLLGPNLSEDNKKWIHGTVNPILREIGMDAIARFNAAQHEATSLFPGSPEVAVMNARLKILAQFIQELKQSE